MTRSCRVTHDRRTLLAFVLIPDYKTRRVREALIVVYSVNNREYTFVSFYSTLKRETGNNNNDTNSTSRIMIRGNKNGPKIQLKDQAAT